MDTLILMGDIIEFWMTPLSEQPEYPSVILNDTNRYGSNIPAFRNRIITIANSGIKVIHVLRGNHDDAMDLQLATLAYNGTVNFTIENDLVLDGVHFIHGHIPDVFDTPDPAGIPPFGNYMSRAVAQTGYLSATSSTSIIKEFFWQQCDRPFCRLNLS